MSKYLIERIRALHNVSIHFETKITQPRTNDEGFLAGEEVTQSAPHGCLELEAQHIFVFIGADPNTGWLSDCDVLIDSKGFVLTGVGLQDQTGSRLGRKQMPIETSMPHELLLEMREVAAQQSSRSCRRRCRSRRSSPFGACAIQSRTGDGT